MLQSNCNYAFLSILHQCDQNNKKYQIQSEPHNELLTFYQILELSYLQNNSTSICNFIKYHMDQLNQTEILLNYDISIAY